VLKRAAESVEVAATSVGVTSSHSRREATEICGLRSPLGSDLPVSSRRRQSHHRLLPLRARNCRCRRLPAGLDERHACPPESAAARERSARTSRKRAARVSDVADRVCANKPVKGRIPPQVRALNRDALIRPQVDVAEARHRAVRGNQIVLPAQRSDFYAKREPGHTRARVRQVARRGCDRAQEAKFDRRGSGMKKLRKTVCGA